MTPQNKYNSVANSNELGQMLQNLIYFFLNDVDIQQAQSNLLQWAFKSFSNLKTVDDLKMHFTLNCPFTTSRYVNGVFGDVS